MKVRSIKKKIRFRNSDGEVIEQFPLFPASRSELEDWDKIPVGKILKTTVTQSRESGSNYHDQFMAVLRFSFYNWPENKFKFKTFTLFRKYVLIKIEWTEILSDGVEQWMIVKSMKFEEVDQIEFMEAIYNPGMAFIEQILGMGRKELIEASLNYSYNRKLFQGKI